MTVGTRPRFAPSFFAAGARLGCWYSAVTLADMGLKSGDAVARWPDLSGNGRDLTAVGAARPSFRVVSGVPVVRFDGMDDVLSGSAFLTGDRGSIYIVVACTVLNFNALVGSADDASSNRFVAVSVTNLGAIVVFQQNADAIDRVQGPDGRVTTAWALLEYHSSGSVYELVVNGINQALTVITGVNAGDWFADSASRDNVTLGGLIDSTPAFSAQDIAEVVVFDGVAVAAGADRQAMRRGIASRNKLLLGTTAPTLIGV